MFIKLFFATSLLLTAPALASSDLDHPLTVTELVAIALENHPSTKQAWWNANRAAAALGSAKSAYYPSVDLKTFITHGKDFKFINGPNTSFTIIGADLLLSMMLYDFGERSADVKAAKMSLLAANWQVDWNIQKVMIGVLETAYAMLHAQENLLAARISLDDTDRLLNAAVELNRAGLSPISDVYTARAAFAQMKMELTKQKSLRAIQNGKLAASLGISADVPLELVAVDQIQPSQTQQTAELISLAYRQRADLMAKQAKLSESFANQAKTRASYRPKLSLSGRGGANHAFHDKTNAMQYEITLNLGIPLFDGFETMYQNRVAFADAQISMEELAELELNISLEVLTNSQLLEAAQEMLPDADEDLKNSIKAYESVLEKYKAGRERIAEVSNALRQLAAARVRYSDVKTQWLIAVGKLAYATGTLAPYLEKRCEN
jgi:outer membrane protein